jgi:hypothetical protein
VDEQQLRADYAAAQLSAAKARQFGIWAVCCGVGWQLVWIAFTLYVRVRFQL